MTAREFLDSDDCVNLKKGFGLNEVQTNIVCSVMEEYAKRKIRDITKGAFI